MGTNYYAEERPPCEHCGRPFERLHIGKSSAGWKFLFAPYPEYGLTSWESWQEYLAGRIIIDEYGRGHTLDALKALVDVKQAGLDAHTAPTEAWGHSSRDVETKDAEGFRFANTTDFS